MRVDERDIKSRAEIIEQCADRARDRAKSQKWDMNLVVFMFAILLLTIILLNEERYLYFIWRLATDALINECRKKLIGKL